MSFYWLKDNVLCYMLEGVKLTDIPSISELQVESILNGRDIKQLRSIDRNELPIGKHFFISLRVSNKKYVWEVNDIYRNTILISTHRNVCDVVKNYIESAINLYLCDRERSLNFRLVEVKQGNFFDISTDIPLRDTCHLIIEISNSVVCVCAYFRVLKGIVRHIDLYGGNIERNKSKVRRAIVQINNKEEHSGLY